MLRKKKKKKTPKTNTENYNILQKGFQEEKIKGEIFYVN